MFKIKNTFWYRRLFLGLLGSILSVVFGLGFMIGFIIGAVVNG